ncbi:hypothetical protein M422DRAFT_33852 [Sphaerobolus stellatus SS14]|uniref:DUF1308 domain-containing protein n=1 Tax=Sphaerobolus stellatus (strain SS14) TaxID=990650 RepID=A0A0C9URA9_SPHS4|nr:hypothetical protein M422DRAFT_33852 [Sphaerobolus stellatus SS14]
MSSEIQSKELLELEQLRAILRSVPKLDSQGLRFPIIDGDGYSRHKDPIYGLRFFRESVSKEVEVLEQFLAKPHRTKELSTNASYFLAVWNEILAAPPPIVAIGKEFPLPKIPDKSDKSSSSTPTTSTKRGSNKAGVIKVDIVADEGRKWIRVNTIKNSRILAEFREFDSYLTGSDSEDGEEDGEDLPTDEDNSLLRMGRALISASSIPIAGTNEKPSVVLRLTRLDPDPSDGPNDPRIGQIIDLLRKMGIDVQIGEREFKSIPNETPSESPSIPAEFRPTNKINMDLSMLIALVSDLSHAALPGTAKEAEDRFRMPSHGRSWKLGKGNREISQAPASTPDSPVDDEDFSKHSRALASQCMQEMQHGLVDEIVGRLQSAFGDQNAVEFWTTEEARERCLRIVQKIGGEGEKQRARALFSDDPEKDVTRRREEFWKGSRYPPTYLSTLIPIKIFSPDKGQLPTSVPSIFWGHLIQTCRHILEYDSTPHPRLFRKYGEMERAKVSTVNTKLTMHTVESMLVGACEGMTTLTANKASIKALLREMKGVKQGNEELDIPVASEDVNLAAIWITEPRSLAEGMRADLLTNEDEESQ